MGRPLQVLRRRGGVVVAALVGVLAACGGDAAGDGPDGATGAGDVDAGADGICTPSCVFKACGDDGCGGVCGVCGADERCEDFQCRVGGGGDVVEPPDPSGDIDNDGHPNGRDNCVEVFNPNQSDLDGDGRGDPCDDDIDGDQYSNGADCNPSNPRVSPGARELCGDGVDNDCDGGTDEEDAWDCTQFFVDADGDGAGASGSMRCLCAPTGQHRVTVGGDCDDDDDMRSPLLRERCDGDDDNCNLLIDDGCDDDGDGYCDVAHQVVGTPEVCPLGGGDCNDYWASVNPDAVEVEGDGFDNDCDGAAQGDGTLTPIEPTCTGPCTGNSVDALLCAAEICYPDLVGAASVVSPTGGSIASFYNAVTRWGSASNDLAVRAGSSYALLGTGPVASPDHDTFPGATCDPSWGVPCHYEPLSGDEMYDAVELKIVMTAPAGATGFSLDYIFMSAEYEEFIGTEFNDKFFIVLRAPTTTGNQRRIINFTTCSEPNYYFDFQENGQKWCYIAINTAFSEPCTNPQTNIDGTRHECENPGRSSGIGGSSTGWLSTSWPIQGGESFELTFHIHDTADDAYNSHVILDNFRWEGGSFQQGTISHH